LLAMLALAVALNVAVVAPGATVTVPATVSEALLLPSVTLEPPAGAVCVKVTVHVLTALCPKLVGLQATPDTSTGVTRLMVTICELLPRVAVTVALWLVPKVAEAVALKVAMVAPAATVTDAGTVSAALLLARVTLDPPVGAVWASITVQVPTALCPRLAGLQVSWESDTAGVDAAPLNAMTVADQMSDTLRVAVALVVRVVAATRSADSTQLEYASHCVVPLPDISRFV
jgi:hypothetical protein